MKALSTIAIVALLLVMLVGSVSLALTSPAWLCVSYGVMCAWGAYQAMEGLGEVWTRRPVGKDGAR